MSSTSFPLRSAGSLVEHDNLSTAKQPRAISASDPQPSSGVQNQELLPSISRPLLKWFTWYSRRYLRRHFHSLRVSRSGPPPKSRLPLVVYCNHASWWDPLVCLILKAEFFPDRDAFTPMDAEALEKYKLFRKLGFFGVQQNSRRGAIQFLRSAEAVLRNSNHILAVTPQSRFADPRERPVCFHGGLGHLATRVEKAVFVPMATEFLFWEERLPEILVRFGDPVEIRHEHATSFSPAYWTRLFEQELAATQDILAVEAQHRNPDDFQHLLRGTAGQGGIYDWWRGAMATLKGETFSREHGTK